MDNFLSFTRLADQISGEEISDVKQILINEGMTVKEAHNLCNMHAAVIRNTFDHTGGIGLPPYSNPHTVRK